MNRRIQIKKLDRSWSVTCGDQSHAFATENAAKKAALGVVLEQLACGEKVVDVEVVDSAGQTTKLSVHEKAAQLH